MYQPRREGCMRIIMQKSRDFEGGLWIMQLSCAFSFSCGDDDAGSWNKLHSVGNRALGSQAILCCATYMKSGVILRRGVSFYFCMQFGPFFFSWLCFNSSEPFAHDVIYSYAVPFLHVTLSCILPLPDPVLASVLKWLHRSDCTASLYFLFSIILLFLFSLLLALGQLQKGGFVPIAVLL